MTDRKWGFKVPEHLVDEDDFGDPGRLANRVADHRPRFLATGVDDNVLVEDSFDARDVDRLIDRVPRSS